MPLVATQYVSNDDGASSASLRVACKVLVLCQLDAV